ncbi:MAG: DegQ family serine endoprotease [Myxococcales bacterium]|nr:DegQ family serine endoprotease [Myxococcales bacterium]
MKQRDPQRFGRFKPVLVAGVTALVVTVGFTVARNAGAKYNISFGAHRAFATLTSRTSLADVVDKALPSVVNIASTRNAHPANYQQMPPMLRRFFGLRGGPGAMRPQRGLGSGVIVSSDGLVLTNNHVVAKADKIKVTLADGRDFIAKVVGTDPKSDVALLRLKGAKNLPPIKIGDSSKMRLGDVVLAIGNPFGVGQTVTMGIVSAKGRANVGIVAYEDFIQTDAAINPGNSGGALVNMHGELIGINTAILSRSGGYQGIGFAIPTNMAKPIAEQLLKHGKVVRGWLGVAIQNVTPDLARAMRLATHKGVLISDLDQQGPARRAGVKRGDLVVAIDGKPVHTAGKLRNVIAAAGAHRRVKLHILRNGQKRYISVKLGELPARLGGTGKSPPLRSGAGITVEAVTPKLRNQYSIPRRLSRGAVITAVRPGSLADRTGLRPGDVILEVNRVTISNVSRFHQLFRAARGRVLLLVYRAGFTHYVLMHK